MNLLNRLAEGGQTFAHRFRMLRQVIRIAFWTALGCALITFGCQMARLDKDTYRGAWYHLKSSYFRSIEQPMPVNPVVWRQLSGRNPGAANHTVDPALAHTSTAAHMKHLRSHAISQSRLAGFVASALFALTLGFFLLRGIVGRRKEYVTGARKTSARRLSIRLACRGKASDLRLGPLHLVKGAETQHMLITGGTGSGKTNALHHLLPQIRARGERLIMLDPTGELANAYYRPGDTILNPLDERSLPWHPWAECKTKADRDSLAESLIPISHNERESYWRDAARALFTSVVERLGQAQDHPGNSLLTHWLLRAPLADLCAFMDGTPATAFVDISSEKTAASVRSVAASFLRCLEYLPDTRTPFSVGEWVRDNGKGWLFLHCTPSHRSAVNPLLAGWFSTAVRGLMQMPTDLSRRLWFVAEELPSLNRIRDLELLLTEGRKYGGCGVLALQSPAQLENIYGRQTTQIILGNCATKVVFAERDPEIAERISKVFGQQEVKEYQEGISYGAHQMRDGVTLSKVSRQRPIVSATDLQSLADNRAYVRLPGNYPVSSLRLRISSRE